MTRMRPLSQLFTVSERFHRSVSLEADLNKPGSLADYVVTPLTVGVIERIITGLYTSTGQRSWTLTGPYGAGKSACVLFAARVLGYPTDPRARALLQAASPGLAQRLAQLVGPEEETFFAVPVICTRQPLATSLLRGIADALERLPATPVLVETVARARALHTRSADGQTLATITVVDAIVQIAQTVAAELPGIRGVLLSVDELGRALEYAANHLDRGDIELMQSLAEMAARSDTPTIGLLTVLHQTFDSYALGLSPVQQREWSKVRGRFEEIGFLESPRELLFLVSQAIRPLRHSVAVDATRAQQAARIASLDLAASNGHADATARLLLDCLPLHPTTALMLPALVRSRLAQNERSLFAFLCSGEPHGLQEYLRHNTSDEQSLLPLYQADLLYDYVVSALGSNVYVLAGGKRWAEVEDALERLPADATSLHAQLIKTIGMFNLLGDGQTLRASEAMLAFALGRPSGDSEVHAALGELTTWGIAVFRHFKGSYGLWEGSDVDLDACYDQGLAQLDRSLDLAKLLEENNDLKPYIAKRHLHETGTFRYLAPRFVEYKWGCLDEPITLDGADGLVVFLLTPPGMHADEIIPAVLEHDRQRPADQPDPVLYAIPRTTSGLREALEQVEIWKWVSENTPALAGDSVARRELSARLAAAHAALARASSQAFDPSLRDDACAWVWQGQQRPCPSRRALAGLVSDVCDTVYAQAPIVLNELINRRALSSAVARARRNLIQQMLNAPEQEALGIEGYPPELSIYLSVLRASGLHRQTEAGWALARPTDNDPSRVRPLWAALEGLASSESGAPRQITDLYALLRQPPFGVRESLLPIYLIAFLLYAQEEIALFEEGTFVPVPGIAELERLLKAPERFTFQRYERTPRRAQLLAGYTKALGLPPAAAGDALAGAVLAVVRKLILMAARLPRYAQLTNTLSPRARAVRHSLLTAREPHTLLYTQLPADLGYTDLSSGREVVDDLLAALGEVLSELSSAFDRVMDRVLAELAQALQLPQDLALARAQISQRAEPTKELVTDLGLRAFAMRLADTALPDRPWLESVAAVVASKPPSQWSDDDLLHYRNRLATLGAQFLNMEEVHLLRAPNTLATGLLRLGIIDGTGQERKTILRLSPDHESDVNVAVEALQSALADLPNSDQVKLAALARLALQLMSHTEERKQDG